MVVGAQEKPEVVFGTRPVVWMMLGAKCECSICSPAYQIYPEKLW